MDLCILQGLLLLPTSRVGPSARKQRGPQDDKPEWCALLPKRPELISYPAEF